MILSLSGKIITSNYKNPKKYIAVLLKNEEQLDHEKFVYDILQSDNKPVLKTKLKGDINPSNIRKLLI